MRTVKKRKWKIEKKHEITILFILSKLRIVESIDRPPKWCRKQETNIVFKIISSCSEKVLRINEKRIIKNKYWDI